MSSDQMTRGWIQVERKGETIFQEVRVDDDKEEPVVSLVYHQGRGPATPGVPGEFRATLEMYNQAYTQKWEDLKDFEVRYRSENPEANDEQVNTEINNHLLTRMTMLEALMSVHKLEWVMSWRVFEDRLKVASEAERTRVRKVDSERRRVQVEGDTPKTARRTAKAVTHVPTNPEEKREMTIQLLMSRMGLTREEAMDRLRIMVDVAATAAAPVVKVEPEPEE